MNDFETKYISCNSTASKARHWLDLRFPRDRKFPETIVSSIYFDTQGMFHFREKEESDHIKSKFRIRWYENVKTGKPSDSCFLEFKHKIGERRLKKRLLRKDIFGNESLDSTKFHSLLDELRVHENQTLEHVYPAFQLSYTRIRYFIPDTEVRLCIDSDIHIRKINGQLMKSNFKPKVLSTCVFEVKGETAVLPSQLTFIENLGFVKDSFSKYERCITELIR